MGEGASDVAFSSPSQQLSCVDRSILPLEVAPRRRFAECRQNRIRSFALADSEEAQEPTLLRRYRCPRDGRTRRCGTEARRQVLKRQGRYTKLRQTGQLAGNKLATWFRFFFARNREPSRERSRLNEATPENKLLRLSFL